MIYTIGHSRHSREAFLDLLKASSITALADIRSSPRSRFPQFNKLALERALTDSGIAYMHRGHELGGKFASPTHTYEDIAQTKNFANGICWLEGMARKHRLVLLCSEHCPLDCHRGLLVARHMHETGHQVAHILRDGTVEAHGEFEDRLLVKARLATSTLSRTKRLQIAYRTQARRLGAG